MVFENLFRSLGFWTTVHKWQEPALFRVRLNGDTWPRAACALGIGCLATAALLGAFAVNANPPHPAHALWGLLVAGGLAFAVLFFGAGQSANVRVCEEGITLKRQGFDLTAAVTGHLSFEEASWPYPAIYRVVLVPGDAIERSFAVLLIELPSGIEMVGVPRKIDLEELSRFLRDRQVRVEQGTSIPQQFLRFYPWPAGIMPAVAGLVACVVGIVFYDMKAPKADLAERPRFVRPKNLPDLSRLDLGPSASAFPKSPDKSAEANSSPPPPPPPATPPAQPLLPPSMQDRPTGPGRRQRPSPSNPTPAGDTTPTAASDQPAISVPAPAKRTVATGDQTALIGGPGGVAFQRPTANGQEVVGFSWRVGSWGGKAALAQFEPLAERTPPAGRMQSTVGRDGYVVGGLQVSATNLVHAVRIIFVRQNEDGGHDKTDFYLSEWIGTPTEDKPVTVGDGATGVIGVYGRRAAVIDAIGLVLAPRHE